MIEASILALLMGLWGARRSIACALAGHPYPIKKLVATTWAWECPRCSTVRADVEDFFPVMET